MPTNVSETNCAFCAKVEKPVDTVEPSTFVPT